MCDPVIRTLILTKLHRKFTYHGVFIGMPSGNHKFMPFGCFTDEITGKVIPTKTADDAIAFRKFANDFKTIGQANPQEGIFIETFHGDKNAIWQRKTYLDKAAKQRLAAGKCPLRLAA